MPACAQAISNVLLCCPTPSDYPHCRVSTRKDQQLRMDCAVRAMKSALKAAKQQIASGSADNR